MAAIQVCQRDSTQDLTSGQEPLCDFVGEFTASRSEPDVGIRDFDEACIEQFVQSRRKHVGYVVMEPGLEFGPIDTVCEPQLLDTRFGYDQRT